MTTEQEELLCREAQMHRQLVQMVAFFPDNEASANDIAFLADEIVALSERMKANAWTVNREEVIEEEQG